MVSPLPCWCMGQNLQIFHRYMENDLSVSAYVRHSKWRNLRDCLQYPDKLLLVILQTNIFMLDGEMLENGLRQQGSIYCECLEHIFKL